MKTRSQTKRELEASLMEVDEVSYDIFDWFPIGVCQNVFKHLDGKALIQASAVNKEWNKLSAETEQTKKLKLVFKRPEWGSDKWKMLNEIEETVKVLQKSKRKFENIEFDCLSSEKMKCFLPFLASRAGSWKSVKLLGSSMSSQSWLSVLKIIGRSVEELYLDEICGASAPRETFRRLRSLEALGNGHHGLHHFMRCTSLVKFHWYRAGCPTEDLRRLLSNNHKLEDLGLAVGNKLFKYSREFQFKLKKLKVDMIAVPRELFSFLAAQSQTLESLNINIKLRQETLELILNDMPRLTSLTIRFSTFDDLLWECTGSFPVNTTITSLELNGSVRASNSFERLIRALRSLKRFKCTGITDGVLISLAQAAPALELLETR